MATNQGSLPIDPASDIGWLRLSIDDADGVPNVPADGQATFSRFSDAALRTIIDLYPDDRSMQIGTAYQRIGTMLSQTAQRVRVDDIEIDTRSQADSFFLLARQWFDVSASYGSSDAFIVAPTGNQGWREPEGTPYPIS